MLPFLYFLKIGFDAYICRRLWGRWSGFFWYRLWSLRSILLLPIFATATRQTYTDFYWPMRAIELGLLGWALGELCGVEFAGAALGLVGGIAIMLSGAPGEINLIAGYVVVGSALYAYWRKPSLMPIGFLVAALFPGIAEKAHYSAAWVPIVSVLIAQCLWLSVVTMLPKNERPSSHLFAKHPARRFLHL